MARAKRTRLATGIYSDVHGISIITKVRGEQLEERWKHGAKTHDELIARRHQILSTRIGKQIDQELQAETFAGLAPVFLKTFTGRRLVDVTTAIDHWLKAGFGPYELPKITPEMIATQMAAWEAAKVANSTRRHRRRELSNLYIWKHGVDGINPVRAVKRPPKTRRKRPRDFPYVVGRLILFQMPRRGKRRKGQTYRDGEIGLTKVRLRVMLETGWPHIVIGSLEERDLHLKARWVYIVPRQKGKGVEGRKVPITRRAAAALRDFMLAKAYGKFGASSMRQSFLRAVTKAKAIWLAHDWDEPTPWPAPDNIHPYDLRHAFISRTVRKHGIEAASWLAIHADIRQTQEYDVEQAFYQLAVDAVKD